MARIDDDRARVAVVMAAFDPPDSGMERLIGEICNFEKFDQSTSLGTLRAAPWLGARKLIECAVTLLRNNISSRFIMSALLAEDIKGSSTDAGVNAVPVAFCTLDTPAIVAMLARRSTTHAYTAVRAGELSAGDASARQAWEAAWPALAELAEQRVLHSEHMCLGDALSPVAPDARALKAPPPLALTASNVTPCTVQQRLRAVAAPLATPQQPAADHMWVAAAPAPAQQGDAPPFEALPPPARSSSGGSGAAAITASSSHFMPSAAWVKQLSRASSVEVVPPLASPPQLQPHSSATSTATSSFGVSDANAVLHWRRRALLVGVLPPLVRQFIERYGLYGLRFASTGGESGVRAGWLEPPLTQLYEQVAEMAEQQQWQEVSALGALGDGDLVRDEPAARHKHVAVLGGSFHPITAAHLSVAADVAADESVSEVWIVPCGARPDKPSLTTAAHERLLQCVLAAEHAFPSDLPVYVMPLEVAQGTAVPSYVLLSALACRFRDTRFSLVIGMDLVPTLPKWQFAGGLLSHVSFLVVPRPGYADSTVPPSNGSQQEGPERFQTLCLADGLPTVELRLSSSEVRQRVKRMVQPADGALQGAAGDVQGALVEGGAVPRSRSSTSEAFTGVKSVLCGLVPPYVNSRLLDAEPRAHPRKQLLALTSDPAVPSLAAAE